MRRGIRFLLYGWAVVIVLAMSYFIVPVFVGDSPKLKMNHMRADINDVILSGVIVAAAVMAVITAIVLVGMWMVISAAKTKEGASRDRS